MSITSAPRPTQRRAVRAPGSPISGEDVAAARRVGRDWPARSALCLGVGVAGWGALPLLGLPAWADAALAAGATGSVGLAIRGEQARRRRQLVADTSAALGRVAGPVVLRARRWQGGWVGSPRRIRIGYLPEVDDSVPGFATDLAAVVTRRMVAAYVVTDHDRRRRRLWLQLDPAAAKTPAAQVRAERIVREVLGLTATISVTWGDDETLLAVDVVHKAGVRVATAAQRARVERIVSTMLPGRWRARWDLEADRVRFEVRPELPRFVPNPAEEVTAENRLKLAYGVDEDGRTLVWNLATNAVQPHHLVVGTTGSGKSAELNSIIMGATRRGFAVYITDPKRIEFMGLRNWPNVVIVATGVEEMVAVVHRAYLLMEERYEAIERAGASEEDFDPVILVLDEFRNFHRLVGAWYAATKAKGMPSKCPIFEEVAAIIEKGRSAHVHLATGTQRPDSVWLGGDTRDNLRSRVAMGRLSPQGAMMMWDAAHVGVSIPKGVPGRATALNENDVPVEFQAYWTPDPRRTGPHRPQDQAILDRLRPAEVTHEPLVVVPPEPDEARKASGELTYFNWVDAEFVPAVCRPDLQVGSSSHRPTYPALGAVDDDLEPAEDAAAAPEVSSEAEEYGPQEHLPAGDLLAGDLLLVEDVWVVVESAEADIVDDGYWCVDFRSDEGEPGSLSLSDDEVVLARHPVEPSLGETEL